MTHDKDLHDRMVALAQNLLEATRLGKISWAITDDEKKFLYAGSRSSVTIDSYTDREDDTIVTLSLLNNKGTTVDSIQSEFTNRGAYYESAEWNEVLEDLYYAARRFAYNVDETIESMLADIERGTPSPQPPPKKVIEDPWATEPTGFTDEPPF